MLRRIVLCGLVVALAWGAGALAAPQESRALQTIPPLQDVTRPRVDWFSPDPPVIYTSGGDEVITVSGRVLDDLSGVRFAAFQYRSVVAPDQLIEVTFSDSNRVSGDARDGTYEARVLVPQYSALGAWEMDVGLVIDRVGNIYRVHKSDVQVRQVFGNGATVAQLRYMWLPMVGR